MKDRKSATSIDTLAVHAARPGEAATGDVTPAIHVSTTYERDVDGQYRRGYQYVRDGNPNRSALEEGIAALEGAAAGVAFSSGSAATLALFQVAASRGAILATDSSYHGTLRQLRELVPSMGGRVRLVDSTSLPAVEGAMDESVALVFVETPSNPLMGVTDIGELARMAGRYGALLACDNTFATPVLQRPLDHGASIVLHSSTKYLGGHSDVMGGIIVGGEDDWMDEIGHIRSAAGAAPSPFDCWLYQRSLPTLPLRVRRQSDSAAKIAAFLSTHQKVERVHYPGLESHPNHAVARSQMSGFGGMISFQLRSGLEEAMQAAARVELFTRATSLGGVESLIEHRASIEGPGTTTPDNLLRISVGLESPDDLIGDLEQALGQLPTG
ncbi:MAG: aminotransferase class I/II-fold pyridoxal phosphate-dependent enzyme [Chromatiales bacterium]|nr:aminotransferase class I/II-fold pyridoxal phosphate-dependent enzyme [Chromatiales bacterium]